MRIRIKRLHADARIPAYAHGPLEDAGLDLHSVEDVTLEPQVAKLVPTGLFLEIPPGFEAQIRPRSGLALKNGISVLNSPGTIDADYRGEVGIILINLGNEAFTIQTGDRIAQMVIARHETAEWVQTDTLEASTRGTGGFGHTGKS